MKKFLAVFMGVCLVGVATLITAAEHYTRHNATEIQRGRADDQKDLDSLRIKALDGTVQFKINEAGDMYRYDLSGNTIQYYPADAYVIVRDSSGFSSDLRNTSNTGDSYYQIPTAGKTYIFDLHAIGTDNGSRSYATAFGGTSTYAGITVVMVPTSSSNHLQETTIMVGNVLQNNSTANAIALAGATYIWVAPPPAQTGMTSWGYGDGCKNRQAIEVYPVTTTRAISGVTVDRSLHIMGESKTWLHYNTTAGASAWEVRHLSK